MLNLYININGILMVVLIISLVNSGQGGICWLKRKENGKCQNVLTRNITRQECCGSGTGVGFTEKEMSEAEFFFAIAIDDGANCDSCLESCENANCGLNKRCVVRKGRPKCICAPVCKASKEIKINENYVANKLKSRNAENGNIRRGFHMDASNEGYTKDREAILNGHVENVDNRNLTSNRIIQENVNGNNNRRYKNERINSNQSNNNNNNRDQRNNNKKMWKSNRKLSTDNTTEINIDNRSSFDTSNSDNPFVTRRKIRNRFITTVNNNSDAISLVNNISASVLDTKGNLPKSDKMVTINVPINNNNNSYNHSIIDSNNNNKFRNNLDNTNSQINSSENGARLLRPNSVRHRNKKVHHQQTRSHILMSDISKNKNNNNNNNNNFNNKNNNMNDTHLFKNETYRYKHRTNSENIENKIRSGFYTDSNDEQKHFNQNNNPDETIHNGPYSNPVCGTDGKTYKTECQLKKRACRRESTTLSVAYRGHCQSSCRSVKCASGKSCLEDQNFVPHCVSCGKQCSNERLQRSHPGKLVCGVDGQTYRSFCELKQRACNSGRAIPIAYRGACIDAANCSNINCKNRQTCLTDLATHKPRCVSCGFKCPRKRRPPGKHISSTGDNGVVKICGTNNHTYYSWCQMMKESCSTGYFIDVKNYGECTLDESSIRGNNTILNSSGSTKPESLLWIDDI